MEFTPGQLSTLKEIGIPVWELRTANTEPAVSSVDAEPDEQLLQCHCMVMVESQITNEQAQRLLHAMLLAIGISSQQTVIVTPEQLAQLHNLPSQNKVLLVLGAALAQSLFDDGVSRGQTHQTLRSQLTTVISSSLDELLSSPENKAFVWQDLQLVKANLSHQ
ncbi:MAG: DNA polymerase III subunit psi [Methylophagaceae bacterium]